MSEFTDFMVDHPELGTLSPDWNEPEYGELRDDAEWRETWGILDAAVYGLGLLIAGFAVFYLGWQVGRWVLR